MKWRPRGLQIPFPCQSQRFNSSSTRLLQIGQKVVSQSLDHDASRAALTFHKTLRNAINEVEKASEVSISP